MGNILADVVRCVFVGLAIGLVFAWWERFRRGVRLAWMKFGPLGGPHDWQSTGDAIMWMWLLQLVVIVLGAPGGDFLSLILGPMSLAGGLYVADRLVHLFEHYEHDLPHYHDWSTPLGPVMVDPEQGDPGDERINTHSNMCLLVTNPAHPDACCTCTEVQARTRKRGLGGAKPRRKPALRKPSKKAEGS